MDRKRELKQLYKETTKPAGIFQIKNIKNGKVFLKSTKDLKTMNGQHFQLEQDCHLNKLLQQEWNRFGKEAFAFEVLEILKPKEEGYFDAKDLLKKLEEKWLNQLQPYGDRGYH